MSPETFVLAIIAAIGTSATGIIVGVVSLFVSKKAEKAGNSVATSVDNQVARVTELFTQQQSSNRELMQMVLDDKKKDIEDLSRNVKTLEKDLDNFKTLTETQATDLIKASSKILSMETSIGNVSKDLVTARTQIARLNEQLADRDHLVSSKDKELELRAQEILALTDKLKHFEALEQRVTALQADVDQLKKDIEAMNEEKVKLQKQVDDLTVERDAAIKRAESAEQERDQLRDELRVAKGTGDLETVVTKSTPVATPATSNGFAVTTPDIIASVSTGKTGKLPSLPEDNPHA